MDALYKAIIQQAEERGMTLKQYREALEKAYNVDFSRMSYEEVAKLIMIEELEQRVEIKRR